MPRGICENKAGGRKVLRSIGLDERICGLPSKSEGERADNLVTIVSHRARRARPVSISQGCCSFSSQCALNGRMHVHASNKRAKFTCWLKLCQYVDMLIEARTLEPWNDGEYILTSLKTTGPVNVYLECSQHVHATPHETNIFNRSRKRKRKRMVLFKNASVSKRRSRKES